MRVAFFRGGNNPVDGFIIARSNGPYAHCELLFDDGHSWSSSQWDHGVRRIAHLDVSNPTAWTVVDLGPMDEEVMEKWCEQRNGLPYNWLALVDFVVGKEDQPPKDPTSWFCSEFCVACLQDTHGMFLWLAAIDTSPFEFWIAARAYDEGRQNISESFPAPPQSK